MDAVVLLESRFNRTPDGAVWTQVAFAAPFWRRHLEVFERVRVVARVMPVERVTGEWHRVDSPRVSVCAVPYYLGPWQYVTRAREVAGVVRGAIGSEDAVFLRVPSQLATAVMPRLRRDGRPYGVEVVGDPRDVFASGAVRHPLRPFFRWWFTRQLRRQCAGASAARYVTRGILQRRYPSGGHMVGVSDVELSKEARLEEPRRPVAKSAWDVLTVTSLAQLYKGPDVLIDAVAQCVKGGLDLRLTIVGDGKYRAELEGRAVKSGVGDRVCFKGQLPAGKAVRAELDRTDLFVMPSRTEGLPRAVIEAMARAVPCIGTTVGGIPELLPAEDLVAPGDAAALACKIREVLTDRQRLTRMSSHNLEAARDYHDEILTERRLTFYRRVREATESWLKSRATEGAAAKVPEVPA